MLSRPSTFTRTRAKSSSDRDQNRATRMAARPVESNSDAMTLTEPHAIVERMISGSTMSRLQSSAIDLSYELAPRFSDQKQRPGDDHQALGSPLGAPQTTAVFNRRPDLAPPAHLA